jgi:septum formation protein
MHYVVSGITIYSNNEKYSINSINKVFFKNISEDDICEYLKNDEYKDKAGSYAIQGLAAKFIDRIDGEYESIVGLPIKELSKLLNELNK